MDRNFWLERWQAKQIGFHRPTVHPFLEKHWPPPGLSLDARVLVPLCGKSLDLLSLRRLGHEVLGIELSPLAIEQFFSEHGYAPIRRSLGGLEAFEADGICLVHADLFDVRRDQLPPLGAAYDRAALVAMPPETQSRYAAHLLGFLPETAPLLLITLEYDQSQMPGPPFSTPTGQVKTLFGDRYEAEPVASVDVLADEPRFRARGLSALREVAWSLTPLAPEARPNVRAKTGIAV